MTTRFKYNPLTGQFDITNNVDSIPDLDGVGILLEYDCDASTVVNSLAIASDTDSNTIEPVTSNVYNGLVIGIVESKTSITSCNVRIMGLFVYSPAGLSIGKPVFISASGEPTTTRPVTGSIQVIGMALTSTIIHLIPSGNKTTLI